ncbi:MAG: GNAT family N-acetyltransferase [Candidatus Sumerlaeaceae bacterium]|jgi:predicted acetyltransferase
MEVRTLKATELEKLGLLYRNAYRIDKATALQWLEGIVPEQTYVLADAHRVLSAIQIIPYEVVIGERAVPMGGIGGVATWADQQGFGYAGRLMASSVPRMHELGCAVSFLYPFSYRYYGKFGWALASRRAVYTNIRPQDLPRGKEAPRVRAVVTEDDWAQANTAYTLGFRTYNCLAKRGPREWNQQKKKVAESRYHAYLVLDEGGNGQGYFTCEDVQLGPFAYETVVKDFICADASACREVISFLAQLPTNVTKVTIGLPEKPWLWQFFKEPFVETRMDPWFMARVVDVEKACSARGYACTSPVDVSFALHDTYGPWNEGTWHLHVDNGHGIIERTSKTAELDLSIGQFSAIFVGFSDPLELVEHGELPVSSANAATRMAEIFHDKPTHLIDFF